MPTLRGKFRGCLLGAALGDVIGAAVEAESSEYISKNFSNIDEILAIKNVAEFAGLPWEVGRFTDDTQMMLCVAEWLLEDRSHSPEKLLSKFAGAYEPRRRYGPGVETIFRLYAEHPSEWRALSTAMFPMGSYGNGSSMRVAPIGLAYASDIAKACNIARVSSRPTHSHSLAYQGAVIQTTAVATALNSSSFSATEFISPMRAALDYFSDLLQDTSPFALALDAIEKSLAEGVSCRKMSEVLGTGVTAPESVPMAIYCFLKNPESYERVIQDAVFVGGDTDTIACMAGAISGAFLGTGAIPERWRSKIREAKYSPSRIEQLADKLFEQYAVVDGISPQ